MKKKNELPLAGIIELFNPKPKPVEQGLQELIDDIPDITVMRSISRGAGVEITKESYSQASEELQSKALDIFRDNPGLTPPPRRYGEPTAEIQNLSGWATAELQAISSQKATSAAPVKADGAGKDETPPDAVTLAVIIKNFSVSRLTLLRKIKDGTLKSYRSCSKKKNNQHLVSGKAVAALYPKK